MDSQNSNTTAVSSIVPTTTPVGPPISIETTPTSEAAIKFTKLVPRRIKAISLSGFLRSFSASLALLFPFFARCLTRYLFTLMSAVSVPEKNADSKISIARITKRYSSGMSSLNYSDSFIINLRLFSSFKYIVSRKLSRPDM